MMSMYKENKENIHTKNIIINCGKIKSWEGKCVLYASTQIVIIT